MVERMIVDEKRKQREDIEEMSLGCPSACYRGNCDMNIPILV
jgi:hypothetical protein